MRSERVILAFMDAVSQSARATLPNNVGFALFIAESHDDQPTSYMRCISNIEPSDLIAALEAWGQQNRQALNEKVSNGKGNGKDD